jgi:hypothetical protein
MRFLLHLAVIIALTIASSADAKAPFMPAAIDVGDLTSDGAGGWNYLVRPLEEGETAPRQIFFPLDPVDESLPPATPAQASVAILAGQPLVLVLPNSPGSGDLVVEHTVVGDEIFVQIERTTSGPTDVLWPSLPFEYLHPLGKLDSGDYTLHMTFHSSDGFDPPLVLSGFLSFTVAAIPTPGTFGLVAPALFLAAVMWRRERMART